MSGTKSRPIELLGKTLAAAVPAAQQTLDPPANVNGIWFLDVQQDGHLVIVQWKQDFGFGVSCAPEHYLGEGPDETYDGIDETASRVMELLARRTYTTPGATASTRTR